MPLVRRTEAACRHWQTQETVWTLYVPRINVGTWNLARICLQKPQRVKAPANCPLSPDIWRKAALARLGPC